MSAREGLPEKWAEARLGDVCSVLLGSSPPSSTYNRNGRGLPFFQGKAEFGDLYPVAVKYCDSPITIAHKDDVLISVRAPVGPTNLSPATACIGRGLAVLRPQGEMLSRYLLYAIRATAHHLERQATGTTFSAINGSQLRDHRLPLAPLAEQQRIVEKIEELFSDLDAGTESLKRAKSSLVRYRASVLKAAVEGRLTEEWRKKHPQTENGQMLLNRILRERREKWERDQLAGFAAKRKEPPTNWQTKYEEPAVPDVSELAELPKGWAWCTTHHCLFIDVGFAFKSTAYANEGIRLLRGENIEPGALRWNDVRYWPTNRVSEHENLLLREGDIVLAMDRPLVSAGLKIARVRASDLPCLLVQRMARLRTAQETNTAFLYIAMRTPRFISHLLGEQQGTQLPHISGSSVQAYAFPFPPLAEQDEIVRLVEERLSQIDAAEVTINAELIRSKKLRQGILKQAFEGRLISQDPANEAASAMLERIRISRAKDQQTKPIGAGRRMK